MCLGVYHYPFIVDKNDWAIVHPRIPPLLASEDDAVKIKITTLEKDPHLHTLLNHIPTTHTQKTTEVNDKYLLIQKQHGTSRCACNTTLNTGNSCGRLIVAEQPYLRFWADPSI